MAFGSIFQSAGYCVTEYVHYIYKDISWSVQNRRQFLIKLAEELCTLERSRQHEMPHCDGIDKDLLPNKITKSRICNFNKTRTKCGNCSCCLWYMLNTNEQRMHQFGIELFFWELLCEEVALGVN